MPTKDDLKYFQSMPLEIKLGMTRNRIREWIRYYGVNGTYVSFSGGKDSTVLLHIVREMYPEIEAVFVNTGLEYPEIQSFVKTFDNITILRPKMRFDEVIKKYGYPLISKEVALKVDNARRGGGCADDFIKGTQRETRNNGRYSLVKYTPLLTTDFLISDRCCNVMKKNPAKQYEKQTDKKPFIATMATESRQREQRWLKEGCNAFDSKRPISKPMSFWTEQDVLQYIKQYNVPIASVYGDVVEYDEEGNEYNTTLFGDACGKLHTTGCDRTGCIFCAFGANCRDDKRFQRLKETHPRQYEYCIGGGEYVDGIWQPNKEGLGMGHVFDELNKIYGDGFIKY